MRRDRLRRFRFERRDFDALGAGPVGDDVASAARSREHAHPAALWRALVAEKCRRAEQFLDARYADHVELAERGIDDGVIPGDCAGVRERRLLPGLAGACLHRHDRLARPVRPHRRRTECRGVSDLLQEHADNLGLLVGDQVVEHVGGRDHRLVAKRGNRADPDGLRSGERQEHAGQCAALERYSDRTGSQRERHGQGVRGGPGGGIQEAQAVRPEQHDAVAGCGLHQVVLQLPALRAGLPVAGREDHRVPHPGGGRVLDHACDGFGRGQDESQVGWLGKFSQAAGRGAAEDFLMPRVHRQQAGRGSQRHCWPRR